MMQAQTNIIPAAVRTHWIRCISTSVPSTSVLIHFGPFLVRSLSTLVLSTDLDIHFGPYKATSVLLPSRPSVFRQLNDIIVWNISRRN